MTSMEPDLGSAPEDLAKLVGITVSEPRGAVAVQGDWLIVGVLVVDGAEIEAMPRSGLTDWQRNILLAFAIKVWASGRRCLRGWRYEPEVGWMTKVRIRRRGYDDLFFRYCFTSPTSSSDSSAVLATAGFIAPLGR